MRCEVIKGYDGKYSICDNGVVIRNPSKYRRKTIQLKPKPGRYLRVALYNEQGRKEVSIHRLVAEYFVSNPYSKPWVNHIDGNTFNNNFTNLEWCTPKENLMHSINVLGCDRNTNLQRKTASIQGRNKRILTLSQANEIRNAVKSNTRKELAIKYNVSLSVIDRIVTNKTYRN